MDKSDYKYKALLVLPKGSLILTPNNRLAIHLQRELSIALNHQGHDSFELPLIKPFSAWLESLYISLPYASSKLLTSMQFQLLWVRDSEQGEAIEREHFRQINKLISAWALCHDYQISIDQLNPYIDERSRYFASKYKHVKRICKKEGLISSSELPEFLCESVDQFEGLLPAKIICYEFLELTPSRIALLNAFREYCEIEQYNSDTSKPVNPSSFCVANRDTQVRAAARWAKNELLKRSKPERTTNNASINEDVDNCIKQDANVHQQHAYAKSFKVVCVWPKLERDWEAVNRVFMEELHREELGENIADPHSPIFNISGGVALTNHPMVNIALKLLAFNQIDHRMHFDDLNELINSPLLAGYQDERIARANLVLALKERAWHTYGLKEIIDVGSEANSNHYSPVLSVAFDQIVSSHASAILNLADWCALFKNQLKRLGWPNVLSQSGKRIKELTFEAFTDLSKMSTELKQMTASSAMNCLASALSQIVFQENNNSRAPIQVLGMVEAAGLHADAVWIADFDTSTWPSPLNPNPYLPYQLQVELNLPQSNLIREKHYLERLLHSYSNDNGEIATSYVSEESEFVQPSRLLKPQSSESFVGEHIDVQIDQCFHFTELEGICDEYGPIYEDQVLKSGVSTLRQQAQCPFLAFSRNRLKVKEMQEACIGLTPQNRGQILHGVLDKFWRVYRSQEALAAGMQDKSVYITLDKLITDEVSSYLQLLPRVIDATVTSLEHDRMTHLIHRYLKE